MEWSKLKNIIIIILAAANLFLLVLVVHRQWESRAYTETAVEDAISILWNNGRIRLDREILPEEVSLPALTVSREPELERAQAEALLGALTASADSMRYEGPKGSAQFYANGEFSAQFTAGAYPLEGREPGELALELLDRLGMDAQILSREEGPGGAATVTVVAQWDGVPIFNCTAALVFRDGELREIEKNVSHRLVGTPQSLPQTHSLDLVTLLLRFMEYVSQNSRVCSEITGFTAGYTLDNQSDPGLLTPCWYVSTDDGGYYWNTLTGEIRPEQAEG